MDLLAYLEAATPTWHDRAACKGHGHLFFPPGPEDRQRAFSRVSQAKALCAKCPVRDHCYRYAEAGDEWRNGGVWAGKAARDVGQAELRPTLRRAS